jgi:hypothetical protein
MSNAERPGQTLGYCYGCDRQVEVNLNDFVCLACGNGFIELLDEAASSSRATQNQNHPGVGALYTALLIKSSSAILSVF